MAKRSKQATNSVGTKPDRDAAKLPSVDSPRFLVPAHPPRKSRLLLAISIVLFTLWLLFLLYTALVGPP